LPEPRRFLVRRDGVEKPPPGWWPAQWVLSRALCRFRLFPLGSLPRAKRAAALSLELEHWAPFAEPGFHVGWQDDGAAVWCWDRAAVASAIAAAGHSAEHSRVVPETVIRTPQRDGPRLARALDGVDGQLWRDGRLVASRWWPDVPSAAEWRNLQREAGIVPDQQSVAVPEPIEPVWMRGSWLGKSPTRHEGTLRALEAPLVLAGALALTGATAWFATALLSLRQATRDAEAKLQAAESSAQPVLSARQSALNDLTRIKQLRALDAYPNQLALMGALAELMPKDNSALRSWEYQSGKLKLTLTNVSAMSATHYITTVQNAKGVQNVTAQASPDGKSLTIAVEIVPR
jgi:hypothetical protein